jgi:hypothetical protein
MGERENDRVLEIFGVVKSDKVGSGRILRSVAFAPIPRCSRARGDVSELWQTGQVSGFAGCKVLVLKDKFF